jgi:hypothetical protein
MFPTIIPNPDAVRFASKVKSKASSGISTKQARTPALVQFFIVNTHFNQFHSCI